MVEFSKETDHYYMHKNGRGREEKVSKWYAYFDSEECAIEYVGRRKNVEEDMKRKEQIRSAGVELFDAAVRVLEKLDHPTLGVTIYDADALRSAIAKARGEA